MPLKNTSDELYNTRNVRGVALMTRIQIFEFYFILFDKMPPKNNKKNPEYLSRVAPAAPITNACSSVKQTVPIVTPDGLGLPNISNYLVPLSSNTNQNFKKRKGSDCYSSGIDGPNKIKSSQDKPDSEEKDKLEAIKRLEKEIKQTQRFHDTLKALRYNDSPPDSTDLNTSFTSTSSSNTSLTPSNTSLTSTSSSNTLVTPSNTPLTSTSSCKSLVTSSNKNISMTIITIPCKTCKYADIHIGKQCCYFYFIFHYKFV